MNNFLINEDLESFADHIKDGKKEKVIEALGDVESRLLNSSFKLSLDFHTVEHLSIGPRLLDSSPYEIPRRQYESVELLLTPFHCAIISRRVEIVQLFLEKILEIRHEKPELLRQVLEYRVKVDYNNHPMNLFDKDDRSLDGMNAIHLAARFDHFSMIEIIRAIKLHMSAENIFELVHQRTNHLLITPLHIAVNRSLTYSSR